MRRPVIVMPVALAAALLLGAVALVMSARAQDLVAVDSGGNLTLTVQDEFDAVTVTGAPQKNSDGTQDLTLTASAGAGVQLSGSSGCKSTGAGPSTTITCDSISSLTVDENTLEQSVEISGLQVAAGINMAGYGPDAVAFAGTLAGSVQVTRTQSSAFGEDEIDFGGVTSGITMPVTVTDPPGSDPMAMSVNFAGLKGGISAPVSIIGGNGPNDNVDLAGVGTITEPVTVQEGTGPATLAMNNDSIAGQGSLTFTGTGSDSVDLASTTIASTASVSVTTTGPSSSDVQLASSQKNVSVNMGSGGNVLDLSSDPQGDIFTYESDTTISATLGAKFQGVSIFDTPNGGNTVYCGPGNETVNGDGGNNYFVAGTGVDSLSGGTGTSNTISYASLIAGSVNIDLINGQAVANEGGSTLTSTVTGFSNAIGGGSGDTIIGTTGGPGTLIGGPGGGNTIDWMGGADTLSGGGGTGNTVSFAYAPPADSVTLNLGAGAVPTSTVPGGTIAGGKAVISPLVGPGTPLTSTVSGFQNATGGQGANLLIGSAGANVLTGGINGNTTFEGFGGGDTIDGQGTANLVDYANALSGSSVNVNLDKGTATAPDGTTDKFTDIQGVISGPADTTVEMPASGLASVALGSGFNTVDFSADSTGQTFSFPQPTSVDVQGLNETLIGVDSVIGTSGNDTFDAAGTTDTLNGGVGGTNTLSYAGYTQSNQGVSVDLTKGTATTPAGLAKISNFQNVTGGAGDNTLIGDSQPNVLLGGRGDNHIEAGSGTDYINAGPGDNTVVGGSGKGSTLIGGSGSDTISFANTTEPATIDLTGGPDSGTSGQHEVIEGFRDAEAGPGSTTIIGSSGNQDLVGGSGENTIIPGDGNDTIDGGTGNDNTVSFANRPADEPVTINLATDTATDGNFTDRLIGIQNATGGSGPDTISGGPGRETLTGGPGNETITGGSGSDTITTGNGNNYITAGAGADTITTGTGSNIVEARNGVADTITCGGSASLIFAESIDTINNCPNVEYPAATLGGYTGPSYPSTAPPPPPPVVYPSLTAHIVARFAPAPKGRTRVRELELETVAAGTQLEATCRGSQFKACPFKKDDTTVSGATPVYNLHGLFGDVPVPAGTKFELELLKPGSITRFYDYVFERHSQPKLTMSCQPPNEKQPGAC